MKPNMLLNVGGEFLTYPQYQTYQELIASGKSHKEAIKMLRKAEEAGNLKLLKVLLVAMVISFIALLLG